MALTVSLVSAAVFSACGSGNATPSAGGASFSLTIGALIPDTGPFNFAGPSFHKNVALAVNEMNTALKAAGWNVTIKVVSADTETSPVGASSAAQKVIAEGATCLVGALTSSETITAAKSVVIPASIPIVSPSSTAAQISTLDSGLNPPLVYRIAPSDAFAAPALARYAAQALGGASGKTISVAGRNDAYGTGFTDAFDAAWKHLGGSIAGPVIYDPSAASLDSEAGQIVSGSPDGYVIVDFPDGYVKLIPALLRTGQFSLSKAFIGDALVTINPATDNVPATYMNGATGLIATSPTGSAAYRAYKTAYTAFPGLSSVGSFGPQEFDATMMCALGALAADSAQPAKIAAKLLSVSGPPGPKLAWTDLAAIISDLRAGTKIDFEGVSGPINWDKNGDVTSATYAETQFQSGTAVQVGSLPYSPGQ